VGKKAIEKWQLTHRSIPALGTHILSDNSSIAALKILLPRRLDSHLVLRLKADVGIRLRGLGGAATVDFVRHVGCWCE
jgi:hypothetical protein